MIEIKKVSKSFDKIAAVSDVSLSIEQGQVFGLLGTNGAGKSTLLRMMAGVLKPDKGEILIGEAVWDCVEAKQKFFYISDEQYFFPNATPLDMAAFYKTLYPAFNEKRFRKFLVKFTLQKDRKIQTFSKGMRKQALFCLIMSTMPEYLILDEPIDGLDPVARKLVWKYIIDDVAQRNLTVLISSHNLKELEGIVDHVGILYKGKIMKEFDLEYIQTHIHKIQVSFGDKEVNLDALNIAYQEERGSVKILIIEDSLSHIRKVIGEKAPLIFDILPLSLEELFMYEVGGEDDDIQKLIF